MGPEEGVGSKGHQTQTVRLAIGALTIDATCCFPPNRNKPCEANGDILEESTRKRKNGKSPEG